MVSPVSTSLRPRKKPSRWPAMPRLPTSPIWAVPSIRPTPRLRTRSLVPRGPRLRGPAWGCGRCAWGAPRSASRLSSYSSDPSLGPESCSPHRWWRRAPPARSAGGLSVWRQRFAGASAGRERLLACSNFCADPTGCRVRRAACIRPRWRSGPLPRPRPESRPTGVSSSMEGPQAYLGVPIPATGAVGPDRNDHGRTSRKSRVDLISSGAQLEENMTRSDYLGEPRFWRCVLCLLVPAVRPRTEEERRVWVGPM